MLGSHNFDQYAPERSEGTKTQPPIYAQIDGEEFVAAERYRIENLFHHLRILVPEDAHWV